MEKIEILEEKIKAAAKTIHQLREKNIKTSERNQQLLQENELLHSENRQVGKLIAELDELRGDRKFIRQKCELLLKQYQKANL